MPAVRPSYHELDLRNMKCHVLRTAQPMINTKILMMMICTCIVSFNRYFRSTIDNIHAFRVYIIYVSTEIRDIVGSYSFLEA